MADQSLLEISMDEDMGGGGYPSDEILLHPELMSKEFLLLMLEQRNIAVREEIKNSKDDLIGIYVRHIMPLPQRESQKNMEGESMEKKREQNELENKYKNDMNVKGLRKRPLIIFDGKSTSTKIKVRKTSENSPNDHQKPFPSVGITNKIFNNLPNSNASSFIPPSTLSTDMKVETNTDTKHNYVLMPNRNRLANIKRQAVSLGGEAPVVKLKRSNPNEAVSVNELKSTETKKKIQRITWP